MKLFERHAFHVQTVDRLPTEVQVPPKQPKPPVDWVKVTALTRNIMQHTVVTGGALYTVKKVVDCGTEIAVIAAKAKFK